MSRPFTWSYSKLSMFEDCAARYKYKHVDRLPEPQSPAAARGDDLHTKAELFLKAAQAPRRAPSGWGPDLTKLLRDLRRSTPKEEPAQAELQIGLTRDWTLTGYMASDVWLRVKIDVVKVVKGPLETLRAKVIDWKSGKMRDGYDDQLKLYGASVLATDSRIDRAEVLIGYIDHDKLVGGGKEHTYEASQLGELIEEWDERASRLERARRFMPNPSQSCRWCPYSKSKGGPCKF